jgi:hypothetical protein
MRGQNWVSFHICYYTLTPGRSWSIFGSLSGGQSFILRHKAVYYHIERSSPLYLLPSQFNLYTVSVVFILMLSSLLPPKPTYFKLCFFQALWVHFYTHVNLKIFVACISHLFLFYFISPPIREKYELWKSCIFFYGRWIELIWSRSVLVLVLVLVLEIESDGNCSLWGFPFEIAESRPLWSKCTSHQLTPYMCCDHKYDLILQMRLRNIRILYLLDVPKFITHFTDCFCHIWNWNVEIM